MADVTNEIMTNDKTKILSGEFLNFYTPRRQRIRSFKVYFSPKQEGSGTPSPENVRPISGWTGVEVSHCGKNLFDASQQLLNGWLEPDGTSGGTSSSGNKHTYKIPIKGGETYTYSVSIAYNTSFRRCIWYDKDNIIISSFLLPRYEKSVTATAPENAAFVSLTIYNVENQKIQFEVGSQATNYTPYKVGGNVPAEYQEVEYIQGNASCHIDTHIKGDDDSLVISGKMLTSIWGQYQSFFGNYIDENHMVTRLLFGAKDNGNIICDVNRKAGNSTTVSMNFTVGEPHEFILEKSIITVDGTLYNYSGTLAGTENDTSIVLNAANIGVVATDSSNYRRWYYFKIQNSQGTILNYIPCYRKSDNVAGMWDTVTKQFYPSIGSEQFVAGPEVNPYSVDWSEEVGTAYGGYVDLISGELAETWKQVRLSDYDWAASTWSNADTYCVYTSNNNFTDALFDSHDEKSWLCNGLPAVTRNEGYNGDYKNTNCFCMSGAIGETARLTVRFTKDLADNITQAKNIMAENDLVVCYKLKIPTYHTLSSTTLSTIARDNNFWSNAGHIEIEYDYIGVFNAITSRKNVFTATPHLVTVSGDNIKFLTDMRTDLKECRINFSPKQTGEGDAGLDNVRPIEGWDEILLYHNSSDNLIRLNYPTGTVIGRPEKTSWNNAAVYRSYSIYVGKNKWVRYQKDSGEVALVISWVDEELTKENKRTITLNNSLNMKLRPSQNIYSGEHPYMIIAYTTDVNIPNTGGVDYRKNMISFGQEQKDHQPRADYLINKISWRDDIGTIYGGYIDLVNREIIKTWEAVEIREANAIVDGIYGVYQIGKYGYIDRTTDDSTPLCNMLTLTNVVASKMVDGEFTVFNSSSYKDSRVVFKFKDVPITVADYNAKLQELYDNGTPLTIAYKLATPVHYPIDIEAIKTLSGINNIWSNTNSNIEISYYKHANDAYQHIAAETITSSDDFIITTDDGYAIGDTDDYIIY